MGNATDPDQQLALALDGRSRVPTQDGMLLALEDWATDPANIRALLDLSNAFHGRCDTITSALLPGSLDAWTDPQHSERVCYDFRESHPNRSTPAKAEWSDAPAPTWRLKRPPEWKPAFSRPSAGRRKVAANSCDMCVEFDAGWVLHRCQVQWHRAVKIDLPGRGWDVHSKFEPTGERTLDWRQSMRTVRVYFVALPAIPSLIDMMGRLQGWKAMLPSLDRDDKPEWDRTSLVIYAPPHADAARLCRQHGVHYLEYHPSAAQEHAARKRH